MGPTGTRRLVRYSKYNKLALPNILHTEYGYRESLLHYVVFPENLILPIILSKYASTHVASGLTHVLLKPTPTRPITTLGDKEIVVLKKLAEIFIKSAPQQVTPPPRVYTPEANPEAAHVPSLMVDPQGDI